MIQSVHSALPIVEDLIEVNKESHYWYSRAAQRVQLPAHQRILFSYAHYRKQFADELELLAKTAIGKKIFTESILEGLFQGWAHIREGSEDDGLPVLEECQQMEAQAIEIYRNALAAPLPDSLMTTIQKQYPSIVAAYQKLGSFKMAAC